MRFKTQFNEFLENTVNLSPGRLSKLGERVAAVEKILRNSEDQDLNVVDARPQGSFAQKTIINPKDEQKGFDADMLVEFESVGLRPTDLLARVKATLKASAKHASLVRSRTRCVTLDYAGEFNLDVVPCVRSGGTLYIANKDTGGWEPTDPDGFNGGVGERDAHAHGHLVPAIRLCKYLRDYKGRPAIKSVILTVLLARRVEARADSDFKDLPTTVVRLLEDLAAWCGAQPVAPVLTEPTCGAELRLDKTNWTAFTTQVESLATRARAACDEGDEPKSLALWRKLFGKRFPAPEQAKRIVEAALDPGEMDLYRDCGIPTDISETVTIRAKVRPTTGFRGGLLNALGRLWKRRWLDFDIGSTTVAPPFDVYWKVKNTGPEAAAASQLRGEITRDDNGMKATKTERTLFEGDHYVEIYVVKDNVCVATDRQIVPIGAKVAAEQ
jgi:hypothetical protein